MNERISSTSKSTELRRPIEGSEARDTRERLVDRDRFLELVCSETQVLKNLHDPSGDAVAEQIADFIAVNPHFDRILVLGIPGSGKTTISLELHQLLHKLGYNSVLNPFDSIYSKLVEYYQAAPKYWTNIQYAYLSYLHACINFAPEYREHLEDFSKLDRHFHQFYENFVQLFENLERYWTYQSDEEYLIEHQLKQYPLRFRNTAYMMLTEELDTRGVDIKKLSSHVTVAELVGAPRGWLRDRGFMSALLDSARELDRKVNLRRENGDGIYPLEDSTFTLMMCPDPRIIDFTKATRSEAVLSTDRNYHSLKQRLLRIGLDVGSGFEDTQESGKILAQIISNMAPLPIIESMMLELQDEAYTWVNTDTSHRPAISRRESVREVKLPRSLIGHPDALLLKMCVAHLEEILLNDLKRSSETSAVGINSYLTGNKKMNLSHFTALNAK